MSLKLKNSSISITAVKIDNEWQYSKTISRSNDIKYVYGEAFINHLFDKGLKNKVNNFYHKPDEHRIQYRSIILYYFIRKKC